MQQSNHSDLVVKAVEIKQSRSKNSKNEHLKQLKAVDNEHACKKSDTLPVKAVEKYPKTKKFIVGQLKQLIIHAAVQQ